MRTISEVKDVDKHSLIAVLTGDGRTELDVIKALAERHDGNTRFFFLPSPPFAFRTGTGLSALKAIKTYLSQYGVAHSLCLIDKEYLRNMSREAIIETVIAAFGEYGITVQNTESLPTSGGVALILHGEMAGRRALVSYLVVSGRQRCIEEDLAELIRLELDEDVLPEKRAIRRVLRRHRTNISMLIEGASNENLAHAFPSLDRIMRNIEENL